MITIVSSLRCADGAALRALLVPTGARIASESTFGDVLILDVIADPGAFRTLDEDVKRLGGGRGTVEVLSLAADAGEVDGPTGAGAGASTAAGQQAGGHAAGGAGSAASGDEAGDGSGGGHGSDSDAEGNSRGARARAGVAGAPVSASVAVPVAARVPGAAAGLADATTAAARGTGMSVRRVAQPGRRLACATCSMNFETSDAHRDHARSEWHHFNLKRKMKELPPVSLDEFDAIPAKQKQAFLENYD